MFFPEFSQYEYDESLWVAVFQLESFVRAATRTMPDHFAVDSKKKMALQLESLLQALQFCLRGLNDAEKQRLIDSFVDENFDNIARLTQRPASSRSTHEMVQELRSSSFQENLMRFAARSIEFRDAVMSGSLYAQIAEAETRLSPEHEA